MAEFTAVAAQTVPVNQNVLFTATPVRGGNCVIHREGNGLVTLRGITNQCRARYRVMFGGNIAVPTGGTPGPISLSISIDGEAIPATQMIETPAAAAEYSNVFAATYVDVPAGCCAQIAVKNTSTQDISVQSANLMVERVA